MGLITARSPISLIPVRFLIRSTSSNTSTLIQPTNIPSTLGARLCVMRALEQTSMEIVSALRVEAELETTLDAASKTLREVLARPLTPAVAAYSLCCGMIRNYPSGGSRVIKSLKISRTVPPIQMVGEPPSPVGLTSLVTFKTRSRTCNVRLVDFFSPNTTLKIPCFLFPVVINITICGDWAGSAYSSGGFPGTCADAVADPSNYDSATFPLPPHGYHSLNSFHRRFDQGREHLRLPEILDSPSVFIYTTFTRSTGASCTTTHSFPPQVRQVFPHLNL